MHETLHQLVQKHRLTPAQTQRLWEIAGAHQPAPNTYRQLRTALWLVAALLLGAGLIFWVAANWAAQTRTFKLHLLQATVALPLAAALLLPAGRVALRIALALLGTLALGGLLAYIGITYQTGADAWQLFAVWALLALPLVGVMRNDGLWVLWLLIAATAIGAWSGQWLMNGWNWQAPDWRNGRNLLVPLLWALVFAWPLAMARLGLVCDMQGRIVKPLVSLRLAAFLALAAWVGHGIFYLLAGWSGGGLSSRINPGFAYNAAFVLLAAWVGWRSRWRDLTVLALAVLGLNALALALIGKWLFINMDAGTGGLLFFALIAATLAGASGRWLYQQQRATRAEKAEQGARDAH